MALRQLEPGFGWDRIWRVAGGWAAGWALAFIVAFALQQLSYDLKISFDFTWLDMLTLPLAGAVGGYALASEWREAQPRLGEGCAWAMAAGWAGCWLVGALVLNVVYASN